MVLSIDDLIEAEIVNGPDCWDALETDRHSWQWWPQGNRQRRICHKCMLRTTSGEVGYGTCLPCLDGIAAFYEAAEAIKTTSPTKVVEFKVKKRKMKRRTGRWAIGSK